MPTLDPKNENHDRFGSCRQLVDAPQKILKRKISGFVTHWVLGDVTRALVSLGWGVCVCVYESLFLTFI